MVQHKKRGFRWWAIPAVLLALIVIVLIAGRWYFRIPVLDYYRASEAAFTIPGLSGTFVPQGLEYAAETDQMLLCGYDKDGGASSLYVVDRKDGKTVKQVTFTLSDGTVCTSHCGGLALHDGLIYLCNSDSSAPFLSVFRFSDLQAVQNGGTILSIGDVPLAADGDTVSPAFVEAGPDGLIAGEFYYANAYETPLSHAVNGNRALAVLLPYDDSALGVSSVPTAAWSLPDKTQGICFDAEGRLYTSESWGTSLSEIEVFSLTPSDREICVLGVTVPLTVLNEGNRISSAKLAPMSEEIAIADGKLYVNCESASKKYYFGILNRAYKLYATDLNFFLREK